jgi:hypothetical protein
MTGIEMLSHSRRYEFIHTGFRKFGDKLFSAKHREDFSVHSSAVRRHHLARGHVAVVGEGLGNSSESGIHFAGGGFRLGLFSLPLPFPLHQERQV